MKTELSTRVLIIGGGATGTAVARDLALRGIESILVEKNDINSGASGGNHGLLHSGARYVFSDAEAAKECRQESQILKRVAPHCIEETGGLFAAVAGDDESYISEFPNLCSKVNINARSLDPAEALELEPALARDLIAAYEVSDATVDPFRLSLEMMEDACQLGGRYLANHRVVAFQKGKLIDQVIVEDIRSGNQKTINTELVINATGAWAGKIATMAGASIDIIYSKGSLLVTKNRVTDRVINRLRTPADADIVVPGGTVSVLGTTSILAENLDNIKPTVFETGFILDECSAMIPQLSETRIIRAYSGVRPLVGVGEEMEEDSRNVSRGFALIDHSQDEIDNLITITGGKLTTCRLMAEKTVDLACSKLGVNEVCKTHEVKVGAYKGNQWTEPGLAPKKWLLNQEEMGEILCECEMVPASSVLDIVETMQRQGSTPDLKSIGLRSRIGKGPCQGAFCSLRVASFLYDNGVLNDMEGPADVREFLESRWRGLRPVINGMAAEQVEMMEALHCGLFGLEQSTEQTHG